ncbi:unnamed protein product [Strongylus vulgaris]|uniref:Uncharacterized protein n=1 Tax=Strongylus vulgaris TaxID=40348 RepID=A0A3P7J462_STRVU|nr:unnamed protein product [Strongylus vulgaris]
MRFGFIDKGMGIPKGVVFVDSVLAIREIEDIFLKEVFEATKELASQRAFQEVAAYEDITAEDNQDSTPGTSSEFKEAPPSESSPTTVKRRRIATSRNMKP